MKGITCFTLLRYTFAHIGAIPFSNRTRPVRSKNGVCVSLGAWPCCQHTGELSRGARFNMYYGEEDTSVFSERAGDVQR